MSMAVKSATTAQRSMPGIGYQGDPGIFGFLGGVAKRVTGAVSRLGIPGISAGAGFVSGALGGILGRKTAKTRQAAQAGMAIPFTGRMPVSFAPGVGFAPGRQVPVPGVIGRIQRALPGGATGMMPAAGPPGPGYHPNKSDYYVKSDPMNPESPGIFVGKGTVWVKNRRRNPLNPRALSRAMSRLSSAKNAAKMLGRVTIRKEC